MGGVSFGMIAVAARDPFNDAVQAESAKVVGHSADRIVGRVESQQLRQQWAHFLIRKPTHLKTEQDQDGEQCLHALVAETQAWGALPVYLDGTHHLVESILTD